MLRLFKHFVIAVIFVLLAGCAGGGCTTGCSCGGITPLAEGFPVDKRIENAASVRLTDTGLAFLSDNVGSLAGAVLGDAEGGVLTFEVPPTSGDLGCFALASASYSLCENGPDPNADPPQCTAEIDVGNANLSIASAAPYDLQIGGTIPLRLQQLPFALNLCAFCFPGACGDLVSGDVVMNGNGTCPGESQTFADIGLDVQVSISIDTNQDHTRYGYSKIGVSLGVDDQDILDALGICTGSSIGDGIINGLLGLVGGLLVDPLLDTLGDTIDEQLCLQANEDLNPPCPTGTVNVDGVCRDPVDNECASIILGLEGNIDLGGLLASFSPGTTGGFDFLFAAGGHSLRPDGSNYAYGDLNPIGQGLTLGMYGGTEPTPLSGCVSQVNVELPTGIPIPDEILQNTLPDWPDMVEGPHFGVALSERFINYMLAQTYNSGALCLGITAGALGDAVPLSTSLIGVGLGATSMTELGRQKQGSEIAIILRPASPPNITIGTGADIETDPLLRIRMDQVSFDFYVWSLDRFVRAFTATMDIDVPLNLMVAPEGLSPVIEKLGITNATVTNAKLIREDPAVIAAALEGLLGDLVGGFLGDALPVIDLNEQLADLGIGLDIPPTIEGQGSPGLRMLTKDGDNFLGIFATLAVPDPMNAQAQQMQSDTSAELQSFEVDPQGLHLATWTADNGPVATIHVGSSLDDGSRTIEWQYKLDKGPWHPFTRNRWLTVDDHWLRTQGKHTVFVRSRVVGDVHSLDPLPTEIELIVDDASPRVKLVHDAEGQISVRVADAVSEAHDIKVRLRIGDGQSWGPWSSWMAGDEIAPLVVNEDAAEVEVEAIDEDGNLGKARLPLINGEEASDAGCECTLGRPSTNGPDDAPWSAWLLTSMLGAVAVLRRSRVVTRLRAWHRRVGLGKVARHAARALGLVLFIGLWSGCSCGDDTTQKPTAETCRERGDCVVLTPGLVGAYTSAAVAPDGAVWVAGYLEGNWFEEFSYGDLAVGVLEEGQVQWKAIDGVPQDTEVDTEFYDPKGFRGGVTESGDDVGLWTSIAITPEGTPAVAYVDATNAALKYASLQGATWNITTVQGSDGADIGRYAKLLFIDGKPTIAYLFIEPQSDGKVVSGVRIATGSGSDGGTWAFEDVATDPDSPCTGSSCPSSYECLSSTKRCAETTSGCSDCSDECVLVGGQPSCEPTVPITATSTYPRAMGLYVSMDLQPDGTPGLAFYDRNRGNVHVASKTDGTWTHIIADGEVDGVSNGDKGIGVSLDIDAEGDYHIAYVNGLSEALEYMMVQGGTTPTTVEIVDDGLSFGDGIHLMGADSDIVVTQGGDVRISYQDSTAGELRYAVGTPAASGHNWTASSLQQDGFAGAFSIQLEVDGARQILNWWRVASPQAEGDVAVVTP